MVCLQKARDLYFNKSMSLDVKPYTDSQQKLWSVSLRFRNDLLRRWESKPRI